MPALVRTSISPFAFALAEWRGEHFFHFQNSICAHAIAHERPLAESAAPSGPKGDKILLNRAMRRDAPGPNNFLKLIGYDVHIMEEAAGLISSRKN